MLSIFALVRRFTNLETRQNSAIVPAAVARKEQDNNYNYEHNSFWGRLTYCVAGPIVALCTLNTISKQQQERYKPRPKFVKYEYLYRRDKRFPWGEGSKTFFHNPSANALPDGYEDEVD